VDDAMPDQRSHRPKKLIGQEDRWSDLDQVGIWVGSKPDGP
jgi:hypothetical protein